MGAVFARILKDEQPWLMGTGPLQWNLRFDNKSFALGFYREEWVGGNGWLTTDHETPETLIDQRDGDFLEHAQRYGHVSPGELIQIWGQLNGSLGIDTQVHMLVSRGIGFIWLSVPTDMAELRGIHQELTEARIGGLVYRPREQTLIDEGNWGRVKRPHLAR